MSKQAFLGQSKFDITVVQHAFSEVVLSKSLGLLLFWWSFPITFLLSFLVVRSSKARKGLIASCSNGHPSWFGWWFLLEWEQKTGKIQALRAAETSSRPPVFLPVMFPLFSLPLHWQNHQPRRLGTAKWNKLVFSLHPGDYSLPNFLYPQFLKHRNNRNQKLFLSPWSV